MESRSSPGPANLRHHDSVSGVLLAAGFSSAMHEARVITCSTATSYGFVLQETTLPFGTQEEMEAVAKSMIADAPDMYPHLRKVATELMLGRVRL